MVLIWLGAGTGQAADQPFHRLTQPEVLIIENPAAILDLQPDPSVVRSMVRSGITAFMGRTNATAAWLSLVSTQDVVGIKVFSEAGMLSGTRPAVVAAVIEGLLTAGLPPHNIIIWDKRARDLRAAGYFDLAAHFGVRAEGSVETGYDPTNFYLPDTVIIGNLVWGDLEFGKTGEEIGRKSYLTKIVSRQITKIISIAPLLNQEDVGVCGHLYSLALGSVDNTRRFEANPDRLAVAVPEIFALPLIGDRDVLNITDALLGQYEGGGRALLHYSAVPGQLWFSRDSVALDVLAIKELNRERVAANAPPVKPQMELYANAALLQLGVNQVGKIHIQEIHQPARP